LALFMVSSDQKLKVLLIGRHELACRVLDALHNNPAIDLACVLARREDVDRRPALARMAVLRSIRILGGGDKLALSDAIDRFLPHMIISAGYDRIIPADALARVPRSVNVHFGMLPKYRGSYSIPWAILNNEKEIGVTLHEMAPSIDDGAIIRQERFGNEPSLSCRDIYDRAVEIGTGLVTWLIDQTLRGDRPAGLPQDERMATYYPPNYPSDFRIPWRQTATFVANYIRAAHFPPYDGAFGEIAGHRLVFGWPVEHRFDCRVAPPGTIVECGGRIGITVINGLIVPKAMTFDKRPADFSDLVAKYSLLNQSFV
jgi:methionyl-tRNA formyltransferase